MNELLESVVSVSGVVGGMIVDTEGAITAAAFPPLYDTSLLRDGGAEVLGLLDLHDDAVQMEFRCTGGIVMVRRASSGTFVVVSEPGVNRQLLSLVLSGAARKLHRVRPASHPPVVQKPSAPSTVMPGGPFDIVDGMPRLRVEMATSTAANYWDQMIETVALTRQTADELFRFYRTKPSKKIKVMCGRSRSVKTFPVRIIADDLRCAHSGKAFLTRSAAEALSLKDGDSVFLQPATGDGIFGWEGI